MFCDILLKVPKLQNQSYTYIVMCVSDCMGFGVVIGYIEHLQIVATSNYSTVANSHTLQFITSHTKPSQFALSSLAVAW
jgi:hypothetical protein